MITEDELKRLEGNNKYGNVHDDEIDELIAEVRRLNAAYADAKASFAGNFLLQLELVRLFEPEVYREWAKTHRFGAHKSEDK